MNEPTAQSAEAPLPRFVRLGLPAILFVVTFLCFQPALSGTFLNWDDDQNFLNNPHYRGLAPGNLEWMFTTRLMGHYQPLSWVTLGLDYTLWKMNPGGYHLTSVLLHAANALLFYFLILALLRAWRGTQSAAEEIRLRLGAAAGALFFSIHPLRAESVAWITERRDVLSGFFFLLTLILYLRMVREGASASRWKWYLLSIGCFGLSLLSKAWGITMPVVLLALDIYPLRRFRAPDRGRVLIEKVPFVILAGVFGLIAAQFAVGLAGLSLEQHSLLERILQSAYGLCFYVWKTVVPIALSPLYLLDRKLDLAEFGLPLVAVIVVTAALIIVRRRWPALLLTWLVYAAIVSPVLGITQSGPQLAADRYTYLSCLAWAVLLAGGLYRLAVSNPSPTVLRGTAVAGATVLVLFGALTFVQSRIWTDSVRLWDQATAVNPQNYYAYGQRATAKISERDYRGAVADCDAAIAITPKYLDAFACRAQARFALRDVAGALADYDHVVEQNKSSYLAHVNRGDLKTATGDHAGAVADFSEAIRLNPNHPAAWSNRGLAHFHLNEMTQALADLDDAIRRDPSYFPAYLGRAKVRRATGNIDGAIADLTHVLSAAPSDSLPYAQAASGLRDIKP